MEENVIPEDEIREMERNFTRDEIKRGINKFKKGKAAGPDGIPNEFYKEGGEAMVNKLEEIFNEVLRVERVPERWNETRVTLIFKGGSQKQERPKKLQTSGSNKHNWEIILWVGKRKNKQGS